MERIILILVLLQGILLGIVTAACPAALDPNRLRGSITYRGTSTQDNCAWTLPVPPSNDYALVLKLRSFDMKYYTSDGRRRCKGYLSVPANAFFCDKPLYTCFIYGVKSECDSRRIAEIVNTTGCDEYMVYFRGGLRRRIALRSTKSQSVKSFSILYKYEKCSRDVESETTTTETPTTIDQTTVSSQNNSVATMKNVATEAQNDETATTDAFVAIIILLIILLIISLLIILWIHRRNRSLSWKQELAPRVQYTLSHRMSTIDHTRSEERGSPSLNAQQTPLHGEVTQQTNIVYSEIGGRSHNLEQQTPRDHQETLQNTYENTQHAPQSTPPDYVYAVVNKSTRRKKTISSNTVV